MPVFKAVLLAAASVAGVQVMTAKVEESAERAPTAGHAKEIEAWRAGRIERLTAPDGWLSLVGLPWLKAGRNTIGSAKDNDIVLAKAPPHLGAITVAGGKATIGLAAGSVATIDGKRAKRAVLLDDSHEAPTTVAFGTVRFYLVERGGRLGLRVKDSEAETRTKFAGIESFPVDPSWRVEADWTPFDPPRTLEVPNVLGSVDRMIVPGKATFLRDGKRFELLPVLETADAKELFLIFADRTSGKETYGAARFLYADLPKDGKVVLDFNKAYNPPCAFTPFATCPLAPPENRLAVPVRAGERKYTGPGAH